MLGYRRLEKIASRVLHTTLETLKREQGCSKPEFGNPIGDELSDADLLPDANGTKNYNRKKPVLVFWSRFRGRLCQA